MLDIFLVRLSVYNLVLSLACPKYLEIGLEKEAGFEVLMSYVE